MRDFIELISDDLGVDPEIIGKALRRASSKFRRVYIPKKSGGFRVAIQPESELKLIHTWLIHRVFSKLPVSRAASAFIHDSSILKNANAHKASRYAVRVDIQRFFPSIRFNDLAQRLKRSKERLPDWANCEAFYRLVNRACFDSSSRLPVGYSTSPSIANSVMYDFDEALIECLRSRPDVYGDAVITRYADDFVFSTNKSGACREFVSTISKLTLETRSPALKINDDKTRFMSRAGGSMLVTGLRVNQRGVVRVHANYRDHVRLLLKLYASGRLGQDEHQKLVGHLAYVEHVDPILFTRLSFRYCDEIERLRS